MRRPNYSIAKQDDKMILLSDNGPWNTYPTITNSAEEVVDDMLPVLKGRRLFYYDSEGVLTELLIKDNLFSGFRDVEDTL